jgi:hypothetical protein
MAAVKYETCPEGQEEHGDQGPCIIINGGHFKREVLCARHLDGKASCMDRDCKAFRDSLGA